MTTSKFETGIYYTKEGLKGVFAVFFTCCMKIVLFFIFTFEEFNVKYGLYTNFLTHSGGIQAVKKYIHI